ncbi:hypothetical protein NESM_000655200 [Novymonas esmeraldas]|uniref:Replication protein A n=1 Tax=Novymonas esmeraldas TaxID=1808958 RepID=A0AAW0ESC5_9TRYP
MDALSCGFCAAALVRSLSPKDAEAWQQRWRQPTLQVVDIQRYPRQPTVQCGPARFYVAVSDGESVAWLVVPPNTPLENSIAAFDMEIGCCVTLLSHALVTAANGLNVIVALHVEYSNNTLRLLGQPRCDEQLFRLSAQSLLRRRAEEEKSSSGAAALQQPSHPIALRDFVDAPQRALGNWCVTARVVWKGHVYPLNPNGGRLGGGDGDWRGGHAAGSPRVVFRCLLVDECGDALVAAFLGGEGLADRVQLHGCYRLAHGTVKWGVGETGAPTELQFFDRSVEAEVTAAAAASLQTLPRYASELVGEAAQQLCTVAAVIEAAQVGEYVSVAGTVIAVQQVAQIMTKRGRVGRAVITVADGASGSSSGGGVAGPTVDVTLWGEVAESVEPALGERWLFHPCAVQLFQQRKSLSSRSSTMAVRLVARAAHAAATALPETLPSASGGGTALDAPPDAPPLPKKEMEFVVDLPEASPTLPVLARVQEVLPPLLDWVCAECGTTQPRGAAADGRTSAVPVASCVQCSDAQLSPVLHVQVRLSDSICLGLVTFHGSAAEALLEARSVDVACDAAQSPAYVTALCNRLVGVPVLVWVLPCDRADAAAGAPSFMAVQCRHIHYVSGCHTLLSAIEVFAAAENNADGAVDAAPTSPRL